MRNIELNGKEYSKIICGSNPFYGHSHFSEARDKEYLNRFNDDYMEEFIRFCLSKGINTIESCANEKIWSIIEKIKHDNQLNFVGTTRIDETSEINSHQQKLIFLLENRAEICVIHSQFVDRPNIKNEIRGLRQMVNKIHANDLLAGISTHKISTIEICENNNYNIDIYLFPLNKFGYVYPGYKGNETVDERIELINKINKPFIIMKSLASGRIPPVEGFKFVLDNIKEDDIISVGLSSIEEAEESLEIINDFIKTV